MQNQLPLRDILKAYSIGLFPMADHGESSQFFWYNPEFRAIIPLLDMHIPRRLKRTVRQSPYTITINQDFESVIEECARETRKRPDTWVNPGIKQIFVELHRAGYAHSLECRDDHGDLVGGLYGLAIGRVFFGETMFSRVKDASKIALVHLAARLWQGGFQILDSQIANEHMRQFGLVEIPRHHFLNILHRETGRPADFHLSHLNESQILDRYWEARRAFQDEQR